jgi:hypothetical protein
MNDIAYFAKAVSYMHKMFMILTAGDDIVKLFSLPSMTRTNKLERLFLPRPSSLV